jgi:hypothetical protein
MLKRLSFVLAFAVTPALAGEEPDKTGAAIQTPSKNIICMAEGRLPGVDTDLAALLSCVRYEPTAILVTMDKDGIRSEAFEGDFSNGEDIETLEYGEHWWGRGFNCYSRKTGLTCEHQDFGSFELSRKGLKKF